MPTDKAEDQEPFRLLLLCYKCHVAVIVLYSLPHGAMSWSVVCDCGILGQTHFLFSNHMFS